MAITVDKMLLEMVVANKKAIQNINKVDKQSKKFEKDRKGGLSRLKAGWIAAAAGIGVAILAFKKIFAVTAEQQRVENQLNAVLKSTGNIAGLTAKEVIKMAEGLQKVTTFGDEAIIAGQNILLTFKKIGADVFPRVTETMLDVAQAMGQDMKTTAVQLGKALNDPIEGLTALRRVGITFEKSQEDLIKTMTKTGDIAGAQVLILDELESQFGGSARAATEGIGVWKQVGNAFGDLQEGIGGLITGMETLGKSVLKIITDFASMIKAFNIAKKEMKDNKEALKEFGVESNKQAEAVVNLANAYEKWEDARKIIETFRKTQDELLKQGRNFQDEINRNIDGAGKFATAWFQAKETLKIAGEEMEKYKEILIDTEITTGEEALEIINARTEAKLHEMELALEDGEQKTVLTDKEIEDLARKEDAKKKADEAEKKRIAERKTLIADLMKFQIDSEKNLTKLTDKELKERLESHRKAEKLRLEISKTFVDGFLDGIDSMKSSTATVLVSMIKSFVSFIAGKLAAMAAMNLAAVVTAPIGVAQLAAAGVVKALGGSIASKIVAAEHGMDSAPGGSVLVGEAGPEIVNLPRGSEVIPNNRINMSRFNTIPAMQGGGIVGGDTIENSGGNIFVDTLEVRANNAEEFKESMMEFGESIAVDFTNP